MLPNPLHPAVVHFPIVLVVLLPIFVGVALFSIYRGAAPRRAWSVPLAIAALAALVAATTFAALRTGEGEEDRVEAVVSEAAIHEHEEAAERLLVLSGVLLLIAVAGLSRGTLGSSARALTAIGSLGLVIVAVQVGAAGGELVYRHNAASAYVDQHASRTSDVKVDD
jgi:uncharacterized membrane protein